MTIAEMSQLPEVVMPVRENRELKLIPARD
jgi:hypothetical protein